MDTKGKSSLTPPMAQRTHQRRSSDRAYRQTDALLQALSRVEFQYTSGSDPEKLFDELLASLLTLTGSSYGFIGEVIAGPSGVPVLQPRAMANLAACELDPAALLDAVTAAQRPVVRDLLPRDFPSNDEVSIESPAGRPGNKSVWLLPIHCRGELVGVAGVADHQKGHTAELAAQLKPILIMCGILIEALKNDQDRRLATESIRESNERFLVMADAAPVLIWMAGTDKRCTYFNKGWLEFTGRPLEKELDDGWAEGIHQEDSERCLEIYTTAFDARRDFKMEYRLRRADGEYRCILDHGVPRLSSDGRFLGYIGSCIDITDRKQAEERVRLVVEAAPNAMIMVNAAGEIMLVNAQVERVFGYGRSELVSQPIEMLIPDRFRPSHPDDLRTYLVDPSSRAMGAGRELIGRRKDGGEVPVEIGLTPIQTPEGSFGLASIIDITERKRAEEALKDERAFLRQVIDINPNFLFAKDREGRFVLVNQAVADAYGTTVENLIGKTDADFNRDPEEVEFFRRKDLETMSTLREQFIPEERITDANGNVRWLQTIKRPMIGKDGTAHQLLGSATDITERKRAELEAARQRDELAHLSRMTMLGELSGSLAHELNQPLTAILANAQAAQRFLADDAPDMEQVREILHDIVKDDERAGEVIHRLREMLRKGETRRKPLEVNTLVQEILKLIHSNLIIRGVSVSTDLEPDLPLIMGDRVQLQQVILNLVVNGAEAMSGEGSHGRKLLIRTEQVEEGSVRLSVRDEGTGISTEAMARLFEPFYTTKTNGLGLGLSICRSIIMAHDGMLWAVNNADRGATFYFSLPDRREQPS
jgi:PAS domain S-box-containing protein